MKVCVCVCVCVYTYTHTHTQADALKVKILEKELEVDKANKKAADSAEVASALLQSELAKPASLVCLCVFVCVHGRMCSILL